MAVIYLPALNTIFHTQPLPMFDLAVCLVLSSLVLFAVEVEFLVISNKQRLITVFFSAAGLKHIYDFFDKYIFAVRYTKYHQLLW